MQHGACLHYWPCELAQRSSANGFQLIIGLKDAGCQTKVSMWPTFAVLKHSIAPPGSRSGIKTDGAAAWNEKQCSVAAHCLICRSARAACCITCCFCTVNVMLVRAWRLLRCDNSAGLHGCPSTRCPSSGTWQDLVAFDGLKCFCHIAVNYKMSLPIIPRCLSSLCKSSPNKKLDINMEANLAFPAA